LGRPQPEGGDLGPETWFELVHPADLTRVRAAVRELKIDRSFVAELGSDREGGEVIIRSTVAMAHSLGLPVIAEGIEVPAQLRRLRSLGCEFGQGHLFSPAVSATDMAALLARSSPAEIVALFCAA
jgi:EAL domain-containing protein (putative c-di-GMP-specific phosphodiesterase class I)